MTEQKRSFARRAAKAVGIGAVLTLGGISLANAAIPDSGGAIHGCYKKDGNLRVIDSAAQCKNDEKALDWNQTGPAGKDGKDGVDGKDATSRWVVMKGDGTVVHSSGVVTLPGTTRRITTGMYEVRFDRAIDSCAALVTPGALADMESGEPGVPEYVTLGRTSLMSSVQVRVDLTDMDGRPADDGFSLAVFC